jgi:hypothetical protein
MFSASGALKSPSGSNLRFNSPSHRGCLHKLERPADSPPVQADSGIHPERKPTPGRLKTPSPSAMVLTVLARVPSSNDVNGEMILAHAKSRGIWPYPRCSAMKVMNDEF